MKTLLLGAACALAFSGAAHAASGASSNADASSGSYAGANTQVSSNPSAQAQSGAASSANSQSIDYHIPADQTLRAAPQASAPALVTTLEGTCMGSASAGGSGMGFGFALGKTYVDKGCEARADARLMAETLHDVFAAKERLCASDPKNRAAFAAAGHPCGVDAAIERLH